MSSDIYALFVRGQKARMFALSDALGFDGDMSALSVSLFEDGQNTMVVQALFESIDAARQCAGRLDLSGLEHFIDKLPDEDWVAKSQSGLPPVKAGRFFIYGSHDKDKIPVSCPYPIEIEAGLAFGTGHHGTTKGCLLAFEELYAKDNSRLPDKILDLGCGTGVLAIAAAKALNRKVLASDIDADAVMVAKQNAAKNAVADKLEVIEHDGVPKHYGKFDLVFANILAGPLMEMADDIAAALTMGDKAGGVVAGGALAGGVIDGDKTQLGGEAENMRKNSEAGRVMTGGKVILSGILDEQADKVINRFQNTKSTGTKYTGTKYTGNGLKLQSQTSTAGWTTLVMGW